MNKIMQDINKKNNEKNANINAIAANASSKVADEKEKKVDSEDAVHGDKHALDEKNTQHHSLVSEMENKIKALEEEKKSLMDRLLRAHAEMDNYRKRMAREWNDRERSISENIIKTLIPVMDNAQHALASVDEKDLQNDKIKGFKMVIDELLAILLKMGVVIDMPVNTMFNPDRHHAISMEPSEEVPENYIIKVFKPGYMLGNKVIREAQVIVSAGKTAKESSQTQNETAENDPQNSIQNKGEK